MKYIIAILIFSLPVFAQEFIDLDSDHQLNENSSLAEHIVELTAESPEPLLWVRPEPKPWPEWVKVPNYSNAVHVCPDGDDRNAGTEEKPFASLEKAISKINGGDAVLLCKGGRWENTNELYFNSRNTCSKDAYCYFGSYGEGDKPYIRAIGVHGLNFLGAEGFYFHGIVFEGDGYAESESFGAFLYDNIDYIVLNAVEIKHFRLGVNMNTGVMDDGIFNTHLAVVNSIGERNRTGFIFGGAADETFIDGNYADGNGAHNYYLSGNRKIDTKNYVFQRNKSFNNDPNNKNRGCVRSAVTVHGYIENLFYVDNWIEEKKGTSDRGCWGAVIDEGRAPNWFSHPEDFPNATVTGNTTKYTGNLNFGFTNMNDGLVGWNTAYVESSYPGVGFKAPSKASEDPETAIKTLDIVYNKAIVEGRGTGFIFNIPQANLHHNEVIKLDPSAKCYVVKGVELIGNALGTNKCTLQAQ